MQKNGNVKQREKNKMTSKEKCTNDFAEREKEINDAIKSLDYEKTNELLKNYNVNYILRKALKEYLSKYKEDKYSDLGGLKEPDFEAINELNPDLIIISGRQADMYDKFAEIATTVYLSVDGSDYLNDFSRNLDVLGKIFGKEDFVKENSGKTASPCALPGYW